LALQETFNLEILAVFIDRRQKQQNPTVRSGIGAAKESSGRLRGTANSRGIGLGGQGEGFAWGNSGVAKTSGSNCPPKVSTFI